MCICICIIRSAVVLVRAEEQSLSAGLAGDREEIDYRKRIAALSSSTFSKHNATSDYD